MADFDRLHSRRHDGEVQLLGFDLLELDSEDPRDLPLERREGELKILLNGAPFGLALNDYVAGRRASALCAGLRPGRCCRGSARRLA